MSSGRRVFLISVISLAFLWSAVTLLVSDTRFHYRNMIESIRAQDGVPDAEALEDAITAYRATLRLAPCNAALHEDMGLLLGQSADATMAQDNVDEDVPLARMQDEVAAQLSCRPADGKAWLDFATLDIYREGFTPRALGAYEMSGEVAPGESWLAQKRLLFALQFRPLFDAKALGVARADLAVLERAHPNRMAAVMQAAEIPNKKMLYAVFDATPTP